MSELQPPEEDHLTTAPPPQLPPQQQTQVTTSIENTKRQRRPSVRLGEIGNQPFVSTWKVPHTKPSSKTRPLTNLANNGNVASFRSYENPIKRKRSRTNGSSSSSKMEDRSFVNESDAFREEHQEVEDEEDHRPLEEENDTNNDEYWGKSADGVREWLIGLGLGRYAPVFEIHEVDDEVLPLLTLEDLKDMGINAVGSRRKMYTAIQKLRKGFS